VGVDERLESSSIAKILRVRLSWRPQLALLTQIISELEQLAMVGKSREIIELLCQVVPTFQPLQSSGVTSAIRAQEHLVLGAKDRA
jgi:hypothetical protein